MSLLDRRDSAIGAGGGLGGYAATTPMVWWPAFGMAFNALAQHAPPAIRASTYLADWILTTSAVTTAPGAVLQQQPWFSALSRHARATVVETVAMSLTTWMAMSYGWVGWPLPINQDIGPVVGGVRADLVYPRPDGTDVAGEARGRTKPAPVHGPNKVQQDRATALHAKLGGAQWFMAWLWLQPGGSTLDFFDPGEPSNLVPRNRLLEELQSRHEALRASASGERIEIAGRGAVAMRQQGWVAGQNGTRTDILMAVFDEVQPELGERSVANMAAMTEARLLDEGRYSVAVSASAAVVMDVGASDELLGVAGALEQVEVFLG